MTMVLWAVRTYFLLFLAPKTYQMGKESHNKKTLSPNTHFVLAYSDTTEYFQTIA